MELLGRHRRVLAAVFPAWFALLAVSYHQSFPPGTIPELVVTLLFAGLVTAAAAGLGTHVLRVLLPGGEKGLLGFLLALGIGLGLAELLVLAAIASGAGTPAAGWGILAFGAVAAGRCTGLWRDQLRQAGPVWREIRLRRWAPPLLALGAAAWAVALCAALAPAEFYDALIYHLAVPARFIASGGAGAVEGNYYAQFPASQGMLYALAMLLRSDPIAAGSLAQVLHWAAGAATVLATFAAGRRHFRLGSALLGTALFALTPGVLLVATFPIADLAAALPGILVLAALLEARRSPERRAGWTRLAGLLAGLAVGVKYTAAISVAAPALVCLGWEARRLDRRRLAELAAFTLIAAAVFSPWLARNLAVYHNPVAPYLSSLFGGGQGPTLGEELARRLPAAGGAGAVAAHVVTAPWRAGMERLGAGGYLGIAFLLLAPFAMFGSKGRRRDSLRLVALYGLAGLAGWSATIQVSRYLLPALPALALLAAEGAAWLARAGPAARKALGACAGWALLHNAYLFGVLILSINPFGVVFGIEMPEDYLARRVSYYPAAAFIDAELPPEAKVLMVGEGRTYYVGRESLANTPFDENRIVALALLASERGDGLAAFLRFRGITHLLVSEPEMARIAATAGRRGYLDDAPPQARDAVTKLLAGAGTRLLFEKSGVRVMEIVPE